ncbi:MAG: phosphoribosylaminoimidazolesuccinocarboxamide synthase, partial [Chitinophagaceae bacterium]|nr:phosphoribosylaminoimidazolesuccinocarboxamide synthase [Chitinophagaceae bacterium]
FMGKEGQSVPNMSDEWVETISNKYIELYERITGEQFQPEILSEDVLYKRILDALASINHL